MKNFLLAALLATYFAEVDGLGVVKRVIVADQAFIKKLSGNWVQTYYDGSSRKNYAGVGFRYDVQRDAFIPPKPFPSWLLDEQTCKWKPPVPMPARIGKFVYWNEVAQSWKETN